MEANSTLLYVNKENKENLMASIEERVENLLQKKIEELGYKLYDM